MTLAQFLLPAAVLPIVLLVDALLTLVSPSDRRLRMVKIR